MDILVKILQFILSFSLLVIVHELGHFMFARIFGVRVERLKLFFGKSIISFKRGETEYAIGWIPFGGYAKLSGMVDESMDTDFTSQPPQPYEFRSKPAWQRLLMMIGGVLMNVILAFLIYVGMSYKWGDTYVSTADMKYGYTFSQPAKEFGFEDGDRILSVNGREIDDFDKLQMALILDQENDVMVLRDGREVEIHTPVTSVAKLMEADAFITPRYPFVIRGVLEGSGADTAGIEPGDSLVSVNGVPLVYFDQYVSEFAGLAGTTAQVELVRQIGGATEHLTFAVPVSAEGKIGAVGDMFRFFPLQTRSYTFWQSFPAGFKRVGMEIGGYWKQLKLIAKPKTEAYKSLGGPLSIGNIFPGKWNWYSFWSITALLSIILAVMNLLPIPGLDGGHVLFLLVEMISGRKPGDKFLMYAQVVGMLLLLFMMIYATSNDIYRLFIK